MIIRSLDVPGSNVIDVIEPHPYEPSGGTPAREPPNRPHQRAPHFERGAESHG